MNRHGSSFGSNNCSKRVVIFVFIHFLCCGFGRVLRSASTGDAPFWGVSKSPVFGPASPVLGWQIPSFLLFFRFLLHRFCVFLHVYSWIMRIFPFFLSNFLFAPNTKWQFLGCVALICDCWVQHNSYHFPVSHWDGSMTYREISVSHWLAWITYRARPLREAVNVYNNIYIFFYMF